MVLMAAADELELSRMVKTAALINDGPSAFRYPRGNGTGIEIPDQIEPLEIGKGRIVREGSRIAILSLGTRLEESLKAADALAAQGFSTTVADARFAKPLDEDLILRLAREHEVLITVEEGAVGGFGAFVLHMLADKGALDRGLRIRTLTLPDVFQDQEAPFDMYETAGLNARHIAAKALEAMGKDDAAAERVAAALIAG
jgi:1-deoxy-D-xylulose-5-phosphate synthase